MMLALRRNSGEKLPQRKVLAKTGAAGKTESSGEKLFKRGQRSCTHGCPLGKGRFDCNTGKLLGQRKDGNKYTSLRVVISRTLPDYEAEAKRTKPEVLRSSENAELELRGKQAVGAKKIVAQPWRVSTIQVGGARETGERNWTIQKKDGAVAEF